jgi:leucyl/phenylalanyl-tRNA--protein transferase
MRSYTWLDIAAPFPPVDKADQYGILAIGGDLSVSRLLDAYSRGIFPWYDAGQPIIWWSPNPRFVLFPDELVVSKSMRQVINRKLFTVTYDQEFYRVITSCAQTRRRKEHGTWITQDMIDAYLQLHHEGYAHSVEVWSGDTLAGGLYGVSLGSVFFGESMFTLIPNASKTALITLTQQLINRGFTLIDSQVHTDHLESLGCKEIPRDQYLTLLSEGLTRPTLRGNWNQFFRERDQSSI